jgi:GNAT superfamily N-acetyltransferase
MKQARTPALRSLSPEEWECLIQSGQGDWLLFDIAPCDGDFLVVEQADQLLAYLQHRQHESHPEWHVLNRLETRPGFRRRGYARLLVERAIEDSGADLVIARGVPHSAVPFWRHLGFEPDGYGADIVQGERYSEGNYCWTRK